MSRNFTDQELNQLKQYSPGPSGIERRRKFLNRHKKAAQYVQNKVARAAVNAARK